MFEETGCSLFIFSKGLIYKIMRPLNLMFVKYGCKGVDESLCLRTNFSYTKSHEWEKRWLYNSSFDLKLSYSHLIDKGE